MNAGLLRADTSSQGSTLKGWKSVLLGEICGRVTTGKLDANAMRSNGTYPFFTCAREVFRIDSYAFDGEALLVSGNGANVGYIHQYSGKFNAYQRTYVLLGFKVDIHLIRYILEKELASRISGEARYGNTPYITMDTLTQMPIAIPVDASEAGQIAGALREIDSLIVSLGRLIAKKNAIKQGVMQQLLTGKIRLPGFTGPWTVCKIGDFAEVKSGGTPSTAVARYWGGTVRWMSSGEIHYKRVDEVQGRITADGLRDSSAQLLPVGTVLMALAGQGKTRGTVAVSRVELSTNQSVAGILPSGEHDPNFLYYNLDTRYLELRGESAGDGGRGGLNLTIIKKLEVLMPNVVEQRAITSVLTAIDDEIATLERHLTTTRNIKQGMMQELLSGRTQLKLAEVAV